MLRGHLATAVALAVGFLAVGGVYLFALPGLQRTTLPGPPDRGLPYTHASYSAAEARRAFAEVGVPLGPRSRTQTGTTLGSRGDVLEVDAFADAATVARSGFSDYVVSNGRYVHFPRACGTSVPDAERWRGNVRVIVSCGRAGRTAGAWLRLVDRALARL